MRMRPRRRGRGVVGTVATAAVVHGAMGAVQHHQQKKWAGEQQAQQQAAHDQQQAQQAAAPAGAADDMMAQLNQLAQLHASGILNDEEFAAAKAKLLG